MIEADAPSTEEVVSVWCCARPTGGGMFAPLTLLRNASRAQSEGPRCRMGLPSAAEASTKAGAPQSPGPGS
jgi:hypothetical protein